ncbi:ABC transporter permease [candidate division TA06 bacterium]|nr:ABC transporter permease [candidate division TA06 bacterium]
MERPGSLKLYIITRLLLVLPMFLILLTLVFLLLRIAPGDPVLAMLGPKAPPERIAELREAHGLNRPLPVQYFTYLAGIFTLDLGRSMLNDKEVRHIIGQSFGATLELTLMAMIIAMGVGILAGTFAGRKRDSPLDFITRLYGILIYSTPIFWLGMMFQLIFGVQLGWFPTGGRITPFLEPKGVTGLYLLDSLLTGNFSAFLSALHHLALPALTLGLVISGIFTRMVRANVIQTMRSDYVEAARARGIPERFVLWRYGFKNALIPVVTVMGLEWALLLGGAVLTETTFTWPGLGTTLLYYLKNRDYIAVQGIITFFALIVIFFSLLVDLINAAIDPRIRY